MNMTIYTNKSGRFLAKGFHGVHIHKANIERDLFNLGYRINSVFSTCFDENEQVHKFSCGIELIKNVINSDTPHTDALIASISLCDKYQNFTETEVFDEIVELLKNQELEIATLKAQIGQLAMHEFD